MNCHGVTLTSLGILNIVYIHPTSAGVSSDGERTEAGYTWLLLVLESVCSAACSTSLQSDERGSLVDTLPALFIGAVYTKTHPHPVKQAYLFSSSVYTKPV